MIIGFIGCGNMASAIIKGLVSSELFPCDEIAVFDTDNSKIDYLCETYGVKAFSSSKQIAHECDNVVLSVKPNVIPVVLKQTGETLKQSNPLILSIAAGKTLNELMSYLPYEAKIARIMPNINAKVQCAVSAYCLNENTNEKDKEFVHNFCNSFGTSTEISEEMFSIYSAIGGCSPAFCYMFIDSMARAAVKNGMNKKQALGVAAAAVMGSAKMILESDTHPWQLIDEVCSPGGTTIEGVASLEKDGFESAVINAVEASYNKDKKM